MSTIQELFYTMKVEPGTMYIGIGCITLLIMVIVKLYGTIIISSSSSSSSSSKKSCPVAATSSSTTTINKKKERPVVICPFSQGTDFIIESADHLPLTPLEMYEDWVTEYLSMSDIDVDHHHYQQQHHNSTDTSTATRKKPLAARWLNMGMSGQDTPGILRAGLRRLKNTKYFLVEEGHRMKYELLLKKKALDDPKRFSRVFVATPESLDAQRECLDMFLAYLPRRYPDQYIHDTEKNTIHVNCIDTTFHIHDYYNTRPLELCERIVQEDLCLMSPPKSYDDELALRESYRMAAAAVVFSFEDLPQKLNQPMEFLHAPVPGYEKHIRKSMNLTFSKLKSEQPVWRNNWGIGPSGDMDKPLYGSETSFEERKMTMVTEDMVKEKFLKVEYETIRRLPKSRYILFIIKSMCDPLYELEQLPMASACLAASIRGMSREMRQYKGIDNDTTCDAILQYLDKIVASSSSSSKDVKDSTNGIP